MSVGGKSISGVTTIKMLQIRKLGQIFINSFRIQPVQFLNHLIHNNLENEKAGQEILSGLVIENPLDD
jgi:hypothetical protein